MAIALRDALITFDDSGNTTFEATLPAVEEGDFVLIFGSYFFEGPNVTNFNVDETGIVLIEPKRNNGSSSYNPRGAIWYRIATSSEPASYTMSLGGEYDIQSVVLIATFSGVDHYNPIDAVAAWAATANANQTQTAPSVTTTVANAVAVWLWAAQWFYDPPDKTFSFPTSSPSGPQTEIDSDGDYWMSIAASYQTRSSTGSTGIRNMNISGTAGYSNTPGIARAISLKPATVSGQVVTAPLLEEQWTIFAPSVKRSKTRIPDLLTVSLEPLSPTPINVPFPGYQFSAPFATSVEILPITVERIHPVPLLTEEITILEVTPVKVVNAPIVDETISLFQVRVNNVSEWIDQSIQILPITAGIISEYTSLIVKGPDPFISPARVIVQDIRSKEFLEWDLPVSELKVTYTLSGATLIQGKLNEAWEDIKDIGIEPWSTWIHVEDQGQIRASGILQPFNDLSHDGGLPLEAVGPSAYPEGIPYMGEDFDLIQQDPVLAITHMWAHLQSYDDGNLGVTIRGSSSARVGLPYPPVIPEGEEDPNPDDNNNKPYMLRWYEGTDMGQEIANLVKQAPMDFIEYAEWNATKTDVLHFIDFADRIGTNKPNLHITQGENLRQLVTTKEDTSIYASQIYLFGAGEGSEIINSYAGNPDPKRIRRAIAVQDNTITTQERAKSLAEYEYTKRKAYNDVDTIVIDARHINAPIGSFGPGDELPLDVDIPWRVPTRSFQRERVLVLTYEADTELMTLSVRLAESFRNG